MNTAFQIQITVHNWEGGSHTTTKSLTLNDIAKFAPLMIAINKNSGGKTWNWFGKDKGLPDKWNGKMFVLDEYSLIRTMSDNFGWKINDCMDTNLVKEFFLRFTPHGADHISEIKIFKVEELELK